VFALLIFNFQFSFAQVYINEGSNKNYTAIADEYGDYPDWIEIYNPSSDTLQLLNYSLSDEINNPTKWVFPNTQLLPGEYKLIFCSGRDKKPVSSFVDVLSAVNYNPVVGWNNHALASPMLWDGVSSLLINICSYSSAGYTTNSVFNQTSMPYNATVFNFQDGSPNICQTLYGTKSNLRPNIRINNVTIGTGTAQNSPYDYPAPYGNWYWASKTQMVIPATELLAAGLIPGLIDSIAFDVVATDPNTVYDYVNYSIKLVGSNEVLSEFEPLDYDRRLHTNFKISGVGDTIYLFSPNQQLQSSLFVNVNQPDNSIGCFPDTSSNIAIFSNATIEATNNSSQTYYSYLLPPVISVPSGIYNNVFSVSLSNPNGINSEIRYTLNGDNPDSNSSLYTGLPIQIFYSNVLKARVFSNSELPSITATSSYLFGISHTTPVLSVITDNDNLYGSTGIFSNWQFDWQKDAYAEYFDTTNQLIFSQRAAMQVDGGAGGSRSHPQHSFRLEFDNSVLGDGSINYPLIPNRSSRSKYSTIYIRNGSNYYLTLPYKDATHVQSMGGETNNYYSAWTPISVYVNGQYFGMYELREKWDAEYFEEIENADADSLDLLSLSYWNGSVLRAVEGSVDSFFVDYNAFKNLNTSNVNYWDNADKYFDLNYYTDYIIGETWAGNVDWPQNNIKIYRSNTTDFRWRFCLIDLEGSMDPFGFSTAFDDHIAYVLNADPNNPYINIFLKSIQNPFYKNYFINRYADLMNTAFQYNKLSAIENSMFNQTVLEMPKEYMRWGDPNNITGQMNAFINNHQVFLSQLNVRSSQVRNHIQNDFSMASQVDVTLNVIPSGAGKIKISTIIPDSLPWTGVYFNGNPVKITALPNPGYEFAFWDTNAVLNVIDTNLSITRNIIASTTFNAVFNYTGIGGKISITEVNYNSDSTRNSGNWIEFHNYGNDAVDMSGWRFTDSTAGNNYIFPQGTILQQSQYLVLVSDTAIFHSQFPQVNVLGPIGFGFNNTSEPLSLFDKNNLLVISMRYSDSLPWPVLADGWGKTLELINDSLNPSLASSWYAGCIGGSPGGPFVPCDEGLIFSEVNYNSSVSANAGDWIEIYNRTNSTMDLSGWKFSDSDNTHLYFIPINTTLQPNERLVLVQDTLLFNFRFPFLSYNLNPFGFGFSSNGEVLRLFDSSGELYQVMRYDNDASWPQGADGIGYTLELVDYNGDLSNGNNWTIGCPEGSPFTGLINPCPVLSINEAENFAGNINVYPNPSNGLFNIHLEDKDLSSSKIQIDIFNYIGQHVFSEIFPAYTKDVQIDFSTNPKGIYILKLLMDGVSIEKKIIVY
jgi:hypothetical protein